MPRAAPAIRAMFVPTGGSGVVVHRSGVQYVERVPIGDGGGPAQAPGSRVVVVIRVVFVAIDRSMVALVKHAVVAFVLVPGAVGVRLSPRQWPARLFAVALAAAGLPAVRRLGSAIDGTADGPILHFAVL